MHGLRVRSSGPRAMPTWHYSKIVLDIIKYIIKIFFSVYGYDHNHIYGFMWQFIDSTKSTKLYMIL